MTGPLADCPVVIDQPVAWDSFGHVNNVVYFPYFENARNEYFARLGWWESLKVTGVGPIVASTRAKFRRPPSARTRTGRSLTRPSCDADSQAPASRAASPTVRSRAGSRASSPRIAMDRQRRSGRVPDLMSFG